MLTAWPIACRQTHILLSVCPRKSHFAQVYAPPLQPKPYSAGGRTFTFDDPCDYFTYGKAKASTLSLSVLVAIEMFNALNALSEVSRHPKISCQGCTQFLQGPVVSPRDPTLIACFSKTLVFGIAPEAQRCFCRMAP